MRYRTIASAAGLAVLLAAGHAMAGAEYYKGKTVTYIVSTKPGGGYDTYGRLIAKYMEKHLPGSEFVVKNIPGAGHIVGANTLYASKPDGLTIGTFNTGLVYAQILDREGVKFDLRKMSWIGKAAADPRAFLLGKDSGVATVQDLRNAKEPVRVGVSGVGSASYNDTRLLMDALDLNLKIIPGYSGKEDEMAVMRGDVAGAFGSRSSFQPFVDNGFGVFAFEVGGGAGSDLPQARNLVTGDKGRSLVALVQSQTELARLTAAPPGTPAAILDTLRAAYRSALTDPQLLAEADKLGIPIVPLYGDDVGKAIDEALNQSPETVALVAEIMDVNVKTLSVKTGLLSVEDKGKVITFQSGDTTVKSKVSGSRTKIRIGGAEGDRKALKAGMVCAITYTPGGDNEPATMECEG